MSLDIVLSAILGAGGATFIGAIVKAWLDVRSGARSREKDVRADLKLWNTELETRARECELDRDFWRRLANGYYGQLLRANVNPVPADPIAPSERTHGRGLNHVT